MAICLPGKASRVKRADFRNAARALGDDHEVDDHQDHEHEQPDREIAADQEGAKGLDHMARRRPASCPRTSTMRVEATLSARRSRVANSRTEEMR
jgi:hypothetical protein